MDTVKITDVCAVEIANRTDPCTRTFPCAKGSDQIFTSLVSEAEFDAVCADVIASGFTETARSSDSRHTSITYESRRERLYVIYRYISEELILIWEKKYSRPDFSGESADPVRVMQIGIGNCGNFTDNPMVGMGFIIRLGNGHAILVDGGYNNDAHCHNIVKAMEKLDIAREDGKFLIDAWYFTHLDGDHVGILRNFPALYKDSVKVGSFVQNFPVGDGELIHGSYPQIGRDYLKIMETEFPSTTIITAHPSDLFKYAGADIRIMYTAELCYTPFTRIWDGNDTSLVFMLEANGKKMLFTGDAGEVSAKAMYSTYAPESLKADVIQFPHHGLTTGYSVFNRVITEHKFLHRIYEYVSPDMAMLPMGETFNDNRWCHGNNQRKWVMENYPQDSYFLDKNRDDLGYDGVNIIKKKREDGSLLTSYMMSSDEEPMITVFEFETENITVKVNETLKKYLN